MGSGLKDFFSIVFKALPVSFFEVDESWCCRRGDSCWCVLVEDSEVNVT